MNYDNYPIVNSLYVSLFDAKLDGIEPFPVRIDEIFHTESDSIMRTLDASETANINAEAFKETIETSMSIHRMQVCHPSSMTTILQVR